jgi:hypothetical protein
MLAVLSKCRLQINREALEKFQVACEMLILQHGRVVLSTSNNIHFTPAHTLSLNDNVKEQM